MSEKSGEFLAFTDLAAETVHPIAHLENDLRDQANEMVKNVLSNEPQNTDKLKKVSSMAGKLLAKQNERDYEWLANQAEARGLVPEIPIEASPSLWLRIQLKRTGVTNRAVARELKISEGHMSAFVKGRKECPPEFFDALSDMLSGLPTKS